MSPTSIVRHSVTLASLVALAATAGCKKDPPPTPTAATSAQAAAGGRPGVVASCDMIAEVGSCTEWAKVAMGLEKGLCSGLKGKFAEGAAAGCPKASEVGSCAMADGEVKRYYSAAQGPNGYTLADAERDCKSPELSGKFSATSP